MGPIANARSWRDAGAAAFTGCVVLILSVLVADAVAVGFDELDLRTYLSPEMYVAALYQCLLFLGLPVLFAVRFGGAVGLAMIWGLLILVWIAIATLVIRDTSLELLLAAPGLIMAFLAWAYFALGIGAATEVYFERLEPLSNSYRSVAVWLFPWILGIMMASWLVEFGDGLDWGSGLAMSGLVIIALLVVSTPVVLSGMFLARLLRTRPLQEAAA